MISKTAFIIVYAIGVVWFFAAAFYTYNVVIKEYIELFRK